MCDYMTVSPSYFTCCIKVVCVVVLRCSFWERYITQHHRCIRYNSTHTLVYNVTDMHLVRSSGTLENSIHLSCKIMEVHISTTTNKRKINVHCLVIPGYCVFSTLMLYLTDSVLLFSPALGMVVIRAYTHALEKTGNILACYYVGMYVLPYVTLIYPYLERYSTGINGLAGTDQVPPGVYTHALRVQQ